MSAIDYTKFFSKITTRRQTNIIRQLTASFTMTPNSINLAGGMPNSKLFPFKEISVTFEDGIQRKLQPDELSKALQYGASQGYLPLRKKWRELLEKWHSPKRNDWDVMVTPGSQDGCNRVFEMLLNEGEPVMVQTPAYVATIGALLPLQPDFIEINQDADGIIPEEIVKVCEKRLKQGKQLPKFIYLNPTGANPTGAVLSETRRRRVYELAQKYDFLIVEDDPYFFVHFLDKQPTSFFSLDTDGRVIRMDSFSKIISSGIRVGTVTAHTDLLNKLTMHVENSILHTSSLSQVLLFKVLDTWDNEKLNEHFKNVQTFYRERRDVMLKAMEKYLTGIAEWSVPEGGMFVWAKIKGVDNVYHIVMDKCPASGIFVIPGNAFYYDSSKPNQHIRISYSHSTPEEIDKGLWTLAKIIKEEMRK